MSQRKDLKMDKKYKKGITFGAYDPLHHGHIRLFIRAKELCDELIVAVSTKDYIEKHKNRKERFNLNERFVSLGQIKSINKFCVQHVEFGKKELVELFKPDVIFVGDDCDKKTLSGEGLGVPVVYLPRTKGL